MRSAIDRLITHLPTILIVWMGVSFCLQAAASLQWRMEHDAPIMLYAGFLMDRFGYVPYRDFFDMNMPGTHLFHFALGRTFGYSDVAFRLFDLGYLVIVLAATGIWMRRFGTRVAWFSALLFGLVYLGKGPGMSLQREYLLVLPVALALLVASSGLALRPKLFWLGVLFGSAATVKPHCAIALPILVGFEFFAARERADPCVSNRRQVGGTLLAAALGFGAPLFAATGYLIMTGALGSFLDMVLGYLPLYTRLSESHESISGLARIRALIKGYSELGGAQVWIGTAALGVVIALYHSTIDKALRREVLLLLVLALAYSAYPVVTGQFWPYHWLLFLYFGALLSSLGLIRQPRQAPRLLQLIPLGVLWFALLFQLTSSSQPLRILRGQEQVPAPKNGRPDQIAAYLVEHARPGDRVQALDWTGGAVHAMLMAELETATPFLYDFHFYHHVSDDYTQHLRERFLDSLERAEPRFVIEITQDKPWPKGTDSSREFPELRSLLASKYRAARVGDGFLVYERIPSA